MSTSMNKDKHIAVFPFPFGTHVMPLLHLVLKLAQSSPKCSFSFIGTEQSNAMHFPKPNIPSNVRPYRIDDGIPEGHPLANHPIEKLNFFLKTGSDNLQKGIKMAEADTKKRVTCIIADAFVTSSLLVAQNLSVPWVAFFPPMSYTLSLYFYVDLIRDKFANCDKNTTLDSLPGLPKMPVEDMPLELLLVGEKETLFSKTLVSLGSVLPQAKAVVMNFFEELNSPLFVQDLRSKLQSLLYVVPVPLPILSVEDSSGCLSWLDSQRSRSVAYISFGTVLTPPPQELVAMAEALEESGLPFLWSLKENIMGILPNGFVERTSKRGIIVSWTPQTQVLAHNSVGVFVSHCGSNSVTESISSGIPMICRPFFGDQGLAARIIQDVWENGIIIEGRMFTKNGLLKSLNLILVQEEGMNIRKNALKLKKNVEDAAGSKGKSAQDFKKLVELISMS